MSEIQTNNLIILNQTNETIETNQNKSKTNIGKRWTKEEEAKMIKSYNEEKLDIIEIAKNHNRLPRAISMRLVLHKIIKEEQEARGYSEYKKSEYYKQQLKLKKEEKDNTQNETKNLDNLENLENSDNENSVSNILNIIYKEIKENYSKNDKIDKITEEIMQLKYLLNNVYEQNKKIINCLSENKMYL
jgi:hypothetical protein